MRKSLFLFLWSILLSLNGIAGHLVGGVITYEHLGGNNYEVTLKVYRDCNSSGAQFDGTFGGVGPAILGIFNGDNTTYNDLNFPPPAITNIDPSLSGLCSEVTIPACVEEGLYQMIISLPPNSTGYKLVYQRCCRNQTINNLFVPEDTGNTFEVFVPPTSAFSENSSPVFNQFPPVALCLNNPLEFDHSATDLDGDSIVYSFCTPFSGATPNDPYPEPASNPPYASVIWAGGYNVNYQIDANPQFNIDAQTGLLTGTPTQQGQYVVGVCAQEFRNGVFISEIRRDFQFNVLICPGQPIAGFAEASVISDCTSTVQFENESINGNTYSWDFGDGQMSNEFEPTHTYDEGGTYEVTLVVSTNGNCPDTTISIIELNGIPSPSLQELAFECIDDQEFYSISIGSLDLLNLDYEWTLDGNPSFDGQTTTIPPFIIEEPGTHTITITVTDASGCDGTDELTFEVNPSPTANFTVNDGPCSGTTLGFIDQSENATTLTWDFDFDTQGNFDNDDNPEVAFPSSGSYDVVLVAGGFQVCPSTYEQTVTVSDALELDIEMPEPQCQIGNSSDFVPVGNWEEPAQYNWVIEDGIEYDPNFPVQNDLSVSTGGFHNLELTLIDANDCELVFSDDFLTVDPLDVSFETDGSGCVPYAAYFDNNTTGGYGLEFLWTFGDGSTGTAVSPFHNYTTVGTFDVGLTVNSTIGCIETQSIFVEEVLTTHPTPEAGFEVSPLKVNIIDPQVFMTSAIDSVACNFYISDGSSYEDCETSHTFNDGGLFDITQYTTNEFGCSNSTTQTVQVTGHLFYAPNAVSMNDDGTNDFFKTSLLGEIVEYEMKIFDRYGRIVFITNDPKEFWRPDYSHDSVFNFEVKVRDKFNVPAVYEGNFITFR